ncbi:MAG: protein translocase subunit SecF [Patescibacteria group bacterium]
MFDLIKYKYLFIGFSVLLTALAIISMIVFGFKAGVDLKGGTLWQIKLQNQIAAADLETYLRSLPDLEDAGVAKDSSGQIFLIRAKEISEADHQKYLSALGEKFGNIEEMRFESIGPAIGKELRDNALIAFVAVLFGISLYIAFAFRKVSYPVSSWKYGFATLISLFHDALIPAGVLALLGWWRGVELDTNFIVAILVIMGFSVHDTIVVFDRIRENLSLSKDKNNLGKIINDSVNQTFARSVNTSLTLVIVLTVLYFLGASSLAYFTLIILLGTIIGTYSSIFVASPLLTFMQPNK